MIGAGSRHYEKFGAASRHSTTGAAPRHCEKFGATSRDCKGSVPLRRTARVRCCFEALRKERAASRRFKNRCRLEALARSPMLFRGTLKIGAASRHLRKVRCYFEALQRSAQFRGTTKSSAPLRGAYDRCRRRHYENLVLLRVIHKVGAASRRFQIGAASRHCETVQKDRRRFEALRKFRCGCMPTPATPAMSLCAAPMTPVAMTPMRTVAATVFVSGSESSTSSTRCNFWTCVTRENPAANAVQLQWCRNKVHGVLL